jgi:hypothetical protein
MLGGSNSGDEFKSHSESETNANINRQSSNHNDVQSEESNSLDFNTRIHKDVEGKKNLFDMADDVDDDRIKKEESVDSEFSLKFSGNGELEKWSNKFKNMPENVVAS